MSSGVFRKFKLLERRFEGGAGSRPMAPALGMAYLVNSGGLPARLPQYDSPTGRFALPKFTLRFWYGTTQSLWPDCERF